MRYRRYLVAVHAFTKVNKAELGSEKKRIANALSKAESKKKKLIEQRADMIWRHKWQTRHQVISALFQYINSFYNTRRRHSTIGGISPADFERKIA